MRPPRAPRRQAVERRLQTADLVFGAGQESLLDILDHVLHKGVVLSGDLTIGLAQIDLIYARLSLLLCAAERVLPPTSAPRRGRGRTPRATTGRYGRR
jgi:hypothetical protein